MSTEPPPPTLTWPAFWRRLAGACALAIALDLTLGNALLAAVPGVGTGAMIGVVNASVAAEADVVVFGASRASRHYDDERLSELLGAPVRNAGVDGRGIRYATALLALCAERHAPKLVVLDMVDRADEVVNARVLAPFAGNPAVYDLVAAGDWREHVKLTSRLYRMNGASLAVARNFGTAPARFGFLPLDGVMRVEPASQGSRDERSAPPGLREDLEGFVAEARAAGARVVFVESPSWRHRPPEAYRAVWHEVAEREEIPLWEFTDEAEYPPGSFKDVGHLNRDGARHFTEVIGERLRGELR